MTDTTHPTDPATTARTHATDTWNLFTAQHGYTATIPAWHIHTSPDGTLLLSGRVVGRGARTAVARFARDCHVLLAQYGDQRPQFNVSQPGRTALVWRYGGVWVELWHPDSEDTPATPAGDQEAPQAVPAGRAPVLLLRRLLSSPGGRLPFTRRARLSAKETTTR